MGNRGSKSVALPPSPLRGIGCATVKEQRVDGRRCGINLPHLRCILMGFERNYQVRIPSNQIIKKILY